MSVMRFALWQAALLAVSLCACSKTIEVEVDGGLDEGVAQDGPAAEESSPDRTGARSEQPVKPDAAPGAMVEVTSFGSNPGKLRMYLVEPPGIAGAAPLVVVLHGCELAAANYANASGWSELALARKFLVVYAEQPKSNNPSACFNWFLPELSSRDKGEALSIKQMVDKVRSLHSVDGKRIFVTGLSAGAAMTVNLLADYPDVFAAGAPMAGLPTGCATSATQALTCMSGVEKTATAWGDLARAAFPGFSGARPRLVAFHGTGDGVVDPVNLDELVKQWTNLHGTDPTPDQQLTVKGHAVKSYKTASGTEVVRTYSLEGMPHGIAVDPGTGPEQGGHTAFGYSFNVGLWSSYYAAQFFGL